MRCPQARNEQRWWKANWLRSVCCISVFQGVCSNSVSTINLALDLYFPDQPELGALPRPLPVGSGELLNLHPGPCLNLHCRFKQSCFWPQNAPWLYLKHTQLQPRLWHCLLDEAKSHQSCSPFSSSAFGASPAAPEWGSSWMDLQLGSSTCLSETSRRPYQNPALMPRCTWAGEGPAWAVVTLYLPSLTALLVQCLTQRTLFD